MQRAAYCGAQHRRHDVMVMRMMDVAAAHPCGHGQRDLVRADPPQCSRRAEAQMVVVGAQCDLHLLSIGVAALCQHREAPGIAPFLAKARLPLPSFRCRCLPQTPPRTRLLHAFARRQRHQFGRQCRHRGAFVLCFALEPVDEQCRGRAEFAVAGVHDVVRVTRLERGAGQAYQFVTLQVGWAMCLRASTAPRPYTAARIASVLSLKVCIGGTVVPRTWAARNQSRQPCGDISVSNGNCAICAGVRSAATSGNDGEATGNSSSSIRWCEVSPGQAPWP
ncbi:hypothetical protein KOJCDNHJ_01918 [Xanthomonas citri pv. punicae]|nr:hypothetical protein KOJCDNHJ_01918 [Xanthomonas citri pv. punicae]